jgi:hypothetical protein
MRHSCSSYPCLPIVSSVEGLFQTVEKSLYRAFSGMRFSDQDVARCLGSTTQPLPGETARVGDAEARFALSILLCRKRIGPTGEFLTPVASLAGQSNAITAWVQGTVRFFAGKRSVRLKP